MNNNSSSKENQKRKKQNKNKSKYNRSQRQINIIDAVVLKKISLLYQTNRANKFYVRSFVFIECIGTKETPFHISISLRESEGGVERETQRRWRAAKGDCNWSKTLVWHWIVYVWFWFSAFFVHLADRLISHFDVRTHTLTHTHRHARTKQWTEAKAKYFHFLFFLFWDWFNFSFRWMDGMMHCWNENRQVASKKKRKNRNYVHSYYSELNT